jgi:hypothetical protein
MYLLEEISSFRGRDFQSRGLSLPLDRAMNYLAVEKLRSLTSLNLDLILVISAFVVELL